MLKPINKKIFTSLSLKLLFILICSSIFQIRFWKVNDPVNTRKEIEIPRKPAANSGISRAGKDMAKVEGLYPFSHMQADIVARNTYYQSKGSDVINFTTPVQAGRVQLTFI